MEFQWIHYYYPNPMKNTKIRVKDMNILLFKANESEKNNVYG